MAEASKPSYGYGKRPLWQWLVIYLIIGGIVYFLIYYFVFAKNGGGYNYSAGDNNSSYTQGTQDSSTGSGNSPYSY